MSELLAVIVWVSIAVLGFAAGLVGIAATRRRLSAPVVTSPSAAREDDSSAARGIRSYAA